MTTARFCETLLLFNERISVCKDFEWIVVGSGASLIQGCPIQPNDLDIMVKRSSDVKRSARLFMDLLPETGPSLIFNKHWLSSKRAVTYTVCSEAGTWAFARIMIKGFQLELANTMDQDYAELSPVVWEKRRLVNYSGIYVPVVPLEMQLEKH
ncbi:hypothetical protein R70723_18970 [Paenibacillus sp. FSL R7-0273]|uniref:hypothetical protein n=1 Tax=Paenibacillus sp. FSL R7-0273 TaxID=1536772 RepID=UPI0004F74656|nr:hypothetical protein [Paenibacillus sp. FSL R7-0273]AIQ47745.1 hypothetical protein R70723_18970 [Paenibacillus sp. FSL R7-0273]OMF94701.1 hypothetical protein BK144_09285 [Paenibacillus sp. FSL R7-0273]